MLTVAQQGQVEGFCSQLEVDGRRFRQVGNAPNATDFYGLLTPAASIDPRLELGSDLRELSTLECLNIDASPWGAAPDIAQQDRLLDVMANATWRVVKRENNPADFTVKFWVVKITGQDA